MSENKILINTYLDSDITSNSLTDCKIYLQYNQIQIPRGKKCYLAVSYIKFYGTQYTFKPTQNTLYYVYDVLGTPEVRSIEFDTTYDYSTIANIITFMNNSQSDITFATDTTASYKLKYTNDLSGISIRLCGYDETEVAGTILYNNCGKRLGCASDMSSSSYNLAGAASAVLPKIYQIVPTVQYHLASSLAETDSYITPSPNENPRLLLSNIPSSSFGSSIYQSYSRDDRYYHIIESRVDNFTLTLLDDSYEAVNLNGSTMIVELTYYFQ